MIAGAAPARPIAAPRRRRPRESVVPMINVVFLLLIFFLMSAELAPPDPLEVTPPTATGEPAPTGAGGPLFMDRDGRLAFGDLRDAEAVAAFAAEAAGRAEGDPPRLRADGAAEAASVAAVLADLGRRGITRVAVEVAPK